MADTSRHDVAVIGAGIIGLAVSMYLVARGLSVLIIDRKGVAAEASGQNAGALAFSDILPLASPGIVRQAPRWLLDPLGPLAVRPSYAVAITPWLIRFAAASRPRRWRAGIAAQAQLMPLAAREFHRMMRQAGTEGLIRRDGSLQVYESEREFASAAEGWQIRAAAGIEYEHVRGAQLDRLQPGLAPAVVAGTFVPHWETVSDPREICLSLFGHLTSHGAAYRHDEVRRIVPAEHTVTLEFERHPPVQVPQVVIAAGAWSGPLAAQLGDLIPLDTERGYNTTLPAGAFDLRRQIVFGGRGFVATPLATGIRIGGAVEFGGLHLPPDFRRARAMLNHAARLLPALQTEGGTPWMGFRPSLPDSLPVIGRARDTRRVVYAFGHGHLGLTQSAATGRLVADLLARAGDASADSEIPLGPFRADRFARRT